MPYADTDFFIALMVEGDRLNFSANKLYAKFKGKLWTSQVTAAEFAMIVKRHGINVETAMADLLAIAEVVGSEREQLMVAARRMDDGIGVFDAFHSVLCRGEIISSDQVYDRLGLKRIEL